MVESEPTIDVTTAAKLLMLTPDRVTQLVRAGHIKRAARGRYALVDVVQGYVRYLKAEARKGSRTAAHSRIQEAKAQEIELRLAEKRRQLIPLEDALFVVEVTTATFRDELLGLPARFTRDMDLRRKLEAETHESLNRMATAAGAAAKSFREGGDPQRSRRMADVASQLPELGDFIPCPRVAYHEAGHFVVALLFGIECDYVEAHSTNGIAQLSLTVPVETDWRLLVVLRAGRFAEGIRSNLTHRPTLEELEHDMLDDQATGYLGRSDLSKIIVALVTDYGDDFMTQYRALEVTTIDILSRNPVRAAIRAVANDLMRVGRLSGADASAIASRHIAPGSLNMEKPQWVS